MSAPTTAPPISLSLAATVLVLALWPVFVVQGLYAEFKNRRRK